jgi:hypothetical protein
MPQTESHISQYYQCPPPSDKAEYWKVDAEYLGADCQPRYYIPGITDRERQEKKIIKVNTYTELLFALTDENNVIDSIEPQTPEDAVQIEALLASEGETTIVLHLNNTGSISATVGLGSIQLEEAHVTAISDTGCLFDNGTGSTALESQPNPLRHYIASGSYILHFPVRIVAELKANNQAKFLNKKLNVFIPVESDNTDAIVAHSDTLTSSEADEHGLVIATYVAANLYPKDSTGKAVNHKLLCMYIDPLRGLVYDELMRAGARTVVGSRSILIYPSDSATFVQGIENDYHEFVQPASIAPILINALGNDGRENHITSRNLAELYVFGVAAYDIDPFTQPLVPVYSFARYSNFPLLHETSPQVNFVAHGTFVTEGGNGVRFSKSGTSMAAPKIASGVQNGLLLLSPQEQEALRGIPAYQVVQRALAQSGAQPKSYMSTHGSVQGSAVIPGELAFNAMGDKAYYPGWTVSPTATISVDARISNYNMADFLSLDWETTPTLAPAILADRYITRNVAELTAHDAVPVFASLTITSPKGDVLHPNFILQPELQELGPTLASLPLELALTQLQVAHQSLLTLQSDEINEIAFSWEQHRVFLPIVQR